MIILAVVGVGIVIYAVYEVFSPGKSDTLKTKKSENPKLPAEDIGKEQKIQRLLGQVGELKNELNKVNDEYAQVKSGFASAKENETKLSEELRRRVEWVAKTEAELAKIKSEDSDLSGKFAAKEKELQEEFTKNVNLTRMIREGKSALDEKEMACRLKEDQIQAQKHQIEEQLKSINEHLTTIAEFKKKEKISEWVPKSEFHRLNEEYSALEKDLEESQAKLKNFAEEIAHLRKEIKPIETPIVAEEPKKEEVKLEEKVEQVAEPKPVPVEETIQTEEVKPTEEIKQEEPPLVEENIKKEEEK